MSGRQLIVPNDVVTKAVFLHAAPDAGTCASSGVYREVKASSRSDSMAGYSLIHARFPGMVDKALCYLDLLVMAAIAAMVKQGKPLFTVADIMRALGYPNPRAKGMSTTAAAIAESLRRLCSVRIALYAVTGESGKTWLDAIPESPLASTRAPEGFLGPSTPVEIVPPIPDEPASALPLLVRAEQANQVIGISPSQMPDFSGRRVSLLQRQMAVYLTVRALEKLPNNKVLVETLHRDIGISFGAGDAGRQARARSMRQLEATLVAMSAQGTVISGFELERERGCIRAIELKPAAKQVY